MPDPDAALRALLPFFDCEKQILFLQELEERIKALVDRARALPKEAEVTGSDYFSPQDGFRGWLPTSTYSDPPVP